jgi:DNA polymerase-1
MAKPGKKGKLLLVDGHSLAYRAFYALPVENFGTSDGQPTNAIYGFASMLVNLIRDEKPTHIAAAFDVSRKTFRSERFPDYKANRSATPDEFRSQMSYLFELVHAMGIRHFAIEGFEADDIIATFAKRAEAAEFETVICTGDRDSFQLVNDVTTVLYPKMGVANLARMTPEAVEEKYGLTPTQYPDFAALRGDPSDNLPSVPGVGEKTATKWIQQYGNLDNLLDHAAEISGKVGDSLRAHVESVRLNQELTKLQSQMEIDATIADLQWEGIELGAVNAFLDKLEIKALKDRVAALGGRSSGSVRNGSEEPLHELASQAPKVHVDLTVKEVTADELSVRLAKHVKPIAFLPDLVDGSITEYAVAISESELFVVREAKVGPWLTDKALPKYVHGGKELLHIVDIAGIVFDSELAAYLINSGARNIQLSDLAERFLARISAENEEELFSNFDASQVQTLYLLVDILERELRNRDMHDLLINLEIPVMLELAKMEKLGIAVDDKKLASQAEFFTVEVARETRGAHKEAGHEFNVGSPKQLQVVLFDELGLPKTKKIKTGYTTDAESLETLFSKTGHPLLQHLLRIRETSKLLTTIDGLRGAIARDGRIHTNFQQTITATGRLSSTNPNLQNIPVRTEEGRRIRDCFISEKPYVSLLTADYSQIEMRIMAHLSKDAALIAAFKSGEDLHSTVASLVFGVKATEVDPEMRRQIKAMSYGLAYGLSAYGLAQQLNFSPTEASQLMGTYFERFGGIRDYLKSVVVEATSKGYTETIMGRRRYLPDLTHDNRQRREMAERMALNAPIQGSAADIIKVAMLGVAKSLESEGLKSRLLLQVHDELIFELADGEEAALTAIVRREMGSACDLSVPLDVNIGIGTSWDLAAH